MWLKNFRQIVERLFCFKDRAPTHARCLHTYGITPFLLAGLAEPNWASTESSARGSESNGAESDASAISRIVGKRSLDGLVVSHPPLTIASRSRARSLAFSPQPPTMRALICFSFSSPSSQASEHNISTILRRYRFPCLLTSIANHRISIPPFFLKNVVDSWQMGKKMKWLQIKTGLRRRTNSNYFFFKKLHLLLLL